MASIERQETSRGVRYNVRYRDPTGRPREKVFRRQKDAARFARQVEVDKDRGLFIDPALARTPLAQVASAWLASNPAKREGSWQRDEIAIRRHIVPVLGDRPIGSLSPGDVQGLVNRWSAVRAPRTVRRALLRMSRFGKVSGGVIEGRERTAWLTHTGTATTVIVRTEFVGPKGDWCIPIEDAKPDDHVVALILHNRASEPFEVPR